MPMPIASTTSRARGRLGELGASAAERKLALVLSDYPARGGRTGYAVGLDTPQARSKSCGCCRRRLRHRRDGLAGRRHRAPPARPHAAHLRCGKVIGAAAARSRLAATTTPRPRRIPPMSRSMPGCASEKIDALVHLGTHGTLEWLPGKALALSAECWPEACWAAAGDLSLHRQQSGRGGAGQAPAGGGDDRPSHAAAQRRRPARRSPSWKAWSRNMPPPTALDRAACVLEDERSSSAWNNGSRRVRPGTRGEPNAPHRQARCASSATSRSSDRDGLHVFGAARRAAFEALRAWRDRRLPPASARLVPPSTAARGAGPRRADPRPADVLPTGRNLTSIDPRAIPTRTAAAIGGRAADEVVRRYLQDHGDHPARW
jgi:cobaltochelatase CobN